MAAATSSVAASRTLLSPAISGRGGPAKPDRLAFNPTSLRLSRKLQSRRDLQSVRAVPVRAAAVEAVESSATAEPCVIDKSVNAIRFLAVDAVEKANSGHPGLPMGCAPMGHILFDEIMRYNPKNPYWFNRDRFVLSAGHGCMLHYALLHLAGYDSVKEEDLKAFRQWGSKTPGHPENFETQGIEVTTGPLGQGIANAVGLALAEKHLAARFNKPDNDIIDHYTYCILGDGCQMEGVSNEACSLAGHWGLGKLIAFYDDNHISIDGDTEIAFTEDVTARFDALGWHTIWVKNGNTGYNEIRAAIREAKAVKDRPTLIKVTTTIGYGSPNKANSYLKYTTVTSNTILSSTSSLFTFFVSVGFLGERFTWIKLISVLLCMGGTVAVGLADSGSGVNAIATNPVLGDFLALLSACLYAVYITLIRKKMPDERRGEGQASMAEFLGYLGLFNLLIFLPVALVIHFTKIETFDKLTLYQFGLIVAKGLLDNVLSDYLWAKAILLTTTTVATAGLSIQVPIAAVVDSLTGHAPDLLDYIGAAAVMVGFVGINIPSDTFCKSEVRLQEQEQEQDGATIVS